MGFYFRKSARFGPFRVNFSKSGVGVSVGIPGLRIGSGPRGNYVQAGAHGFYYRAALPRARARSMPPARYRDPSPTPQPDTYQSTQNSTLGDFHAIESRNVEQIVDSSSEDLLEEIRQKNRRIRWWRFSAVIGTVLAYLTWSSAAPTWAMWLVVALSGGATLLTFWWDVQRKLVVLHYELDSVVTDAFTALIEASKKLQDCSGIWHLKGATRVLDRKYHAGAASLISRAPASVVRRLPPYVVSNIDPIAIALSKLTLYCYPDRLLLYRDGDVGAVTYRSLDCESSDTQFIEDGAPSGDAKVIGYTWRYVNKDGGPDRRFKNNRQLAICRYGELSFTSGSGLNEVLQFSRPSIALDFVISAKRLAAAASEPSAKRSDQTGEAPMQSSVLEAGPAVPVEGQRAGASGTVLAMIAIAFAVAGGIALYFYIAASEVSPSTQSVSTTTAPLAPIKLPLETRASHTVARATQEGRPSQSNPPLNGSSIVEGADGADNGRSSLVPTAPDELAAVRAKDSSAADRIATYCTSVAAAATHPMTSEKACHREEIAAWTRFVVNQEFPKLDAATLAICSQPPFPDSYEGREACAKYELRKK